MGAGSFPAPWTSSDGEPLGPRHVLLCSAVCLQAALPGLRCGPWEAGWELEGQKERRGRPGHFPHLCSELRLARMTTAWSGTCLASESPRATEGSSAAVLQGEASVVTSPGAGETLVFPLPSSLPRGWLSAPAGF